MPISLAAAKDTVTRLRAMSGSEMFNALAQAGNHLAFLIAPSVLFGIALLASLLPALRAARVDPATVLKVE